MVPPVEKLRVGERDYAVVAAVEDCDRHRDPRQQPGKHGQFLGIPADIAHRLGEAVAVVAGQVVRADVLGYPNDLRRRGRKLRLKSHDTLIHGPRPLLLRRRIPEVDTTAPTPQVLVIGLDPYRVPGPWDPKPVADAIEVGIARFAEHGVGVEICLFGLDGSDDVGAVVAAALCARPWECVVIGGGVRHEDQLELFEQVLNLVRQHAPDAAIAFNGTPADTFDAAARWVDIPGPASRTRFS
jgi:hypothetical protein